MPKSWPMCTDMSMLLELQMRLRRAVLGGDTAEIVAAIQGDGLDPAARVGIYRHHAFATLGDALQGTFPVVCRLVDKRFFAYAAHEYLREHPPHSRCLVEYGADFADFLAGFSPVREITVPGGRRPLRMGPQYRCHRAGGDPVAGEEPCCDSSGRGRIRRAPPAALAELLRLALADRRDLAGQQRGRGAANRYHERRHQPGDPPRRRGGRLGGGSTRGPSRSERRSPTASCSLPQWRPRP